MDFEDLQFIKPCSPELERALLSAGHREYSNFYLFATVADSKMMDALVLCRSTLKNAFNEPRDYMPPEFRLSFERVCNHTEQVFTALREGVRRCTTYRDLSDVEQAHIESTLFSIKCTFR